MLDVLKELQIKNPIKNSNDIAMTMWGANVTFNILNAETSMRIAHTWLVCNIDGTGGNLVYHDPITHPEMYN